MIFFILITYLFDILRRNSALVTHNTLGVKGSKRYLVN